MLKNLKLKNFQSHKQTEIEFIAPGVNVIIGPSDAGKSALFRAILWGCFNRPLGESICSYWAKDSLSSVSLSFTQGRICRVRGKSENSYQVNDHILKAFGQDPPEEVLQLHGLDRSLNVQTQIDPFFLLQSTSGDVASYLNRIAGLQDIDIVNKGLQSHLRKVSAERLFAIQESERLKEVIRRYEGLDEIEIYFKESQILENKLVQICKNKTDLKEITTRIILIQNRIKSIKTKLLIRLQVDAAVEILQRLDVLNTQQSRLAKDLWRIDSLQRRIDTLINRQAISGIVKEALDQYQNQEIINTKINTLESFIKSILHIKSKLKSLKKDFQLTSKFFHREVPKGSVCPFCGQVIKGYDK
ncbi:MAG: AAA family ATPase [Nitrosopumilaceae archaeon]|nr:AAA family ATPase [Nitrosopumilaceae archaeon]NIU87809.1 AAA family ATPase [Nitrosopumilaceae archaeon]NIV65191.1 AAA family ATPase [Nitrosopumilaceae archaeon]NIX61707.1 AAA family ATPase [Nitrosopumilaceae archaeon]